MALFLKYRPQSFEDVVGQNSVIQTLKNSIQSHKMAHAYLFSGSRGTGKTSIARIFAKELLLASVTDPQQKKDFTLQIQKDSFVDLIEIDGASNRGIDEIRDLKEKINFAPNIVDKKVYIIDEVHMLTKPAFNALLKTLEEPPAHAYFLLATTEMHKLPDTIISRCQCFSFQRFSLEQLVDRLEYICTQEKFSFEKKALLLLARKAEGGMRDAISLLDQMASETDQNITEQSVLESLGISSSETLESFAESLQTLNHVQAFSLLKKIHTSGGDFRTFGHDFLLFLREQIHQNLNNPQQLERLLFWVQEIEKAIQRLKTTPIIELPFEIAVLNIIQKTTNISQPNQQNPSTSSFDLPKKESETPSSLKPAKKIGTEKSPTPLQPTEIKKEIPTPASDSTSGFVFDDGSPVASPSKTATTQKETAPSTKTKDLKTSSKEFSNSALKERMKLITSKSGLPSFVKQSILFTEPIIQKDVLVFESSNEFHITRLNEDKNTAITLQKTILSLFGQTLPVVFQLNKPFKEERKKDAVATADDFSEYFS